MAAGVDPNDVFHNGRWYTRGGYGSPDNISKFTRDPTRIDVPQLPDAAEFGVGWADVDGQMEYSTGTAWVNRTARYSRPTFVSLGDSTLALGVDYRTATSVTISNGVVTIIVTASHGFTAGMDVVVHNVPNSIGGLRKIATIVDATTFTYAADAGTPDGTITPATLAGRSTSCFIYPQQRDLDTHVTRLFNSLLGSRLVDVGMYACGGHRTIDVLNELSWIDSIRPDVAFLSVGVNDIVNSVAMADVRANYTAIVNHLQELGCQIVLFTGFPLDNTYSGWSTTIAYNIFAHAKWIRDLVNSRSDLLLIESHGYCIDPASATGNWRSGYGRTDRIHPDKPAVMAVAKRAATALSNIWPAWERPIKCSGQTYGTSSVNAELIDNPMLLGTSGSLSGGATSSSGVPTGFTLSAATATVNGESSANSNGDGNKFTVSVTAAGATQGGELKLSSSIHSRLAAGDRIVFSVKCKGNIIDSTFRWLKPYIKITVNGVASEISSCGSGGTTSWGTTFDGVWTLEWVIPAGLTSFIPGVQFYHNAAGSSEIEIENFSIEKV